MYYPPNSINIKDLPNSPIRLGIIGKPGTGKTFSALTFPNPVVADFDNKTSGYRKFRPDFDLCIYPFWSKEFVLGKLKISNRRNCDDNKINDDKYSHNARDAFKLWLNEQGPKLTIEQTLIVDSFTSLNDFVDLQGDLPWEKSYSRNTGEEDTRAFWGIKLKYNIEVLSAIKNLPCNIVCIFHELPEYDDKGRLTGIKPLIQGQSADRAPKDFTDFYRQKVYTKDNAPKEVDWFTDKGEAYSWVTVKTPDFQLACKSNEKLGPVIKADYKSLLV